MPSPCPPQCRRAGRPRAQGEGGCAVAAGSMTRSFRKLSRGFCEHRPGEQLPQLGSGWGPHTHGEHNQPAPSQNPCLWGDRVSPVLTSHYTEVPSRATAQRGRGGMRSSAGRQRGSPGGSESYRDPPPQGPSRAPQGPASEKQWDSLGAEGVARPAWPRGTG